MLETILGLRDQYHRNICGMVMFWATSGPSIADPNSRLSLAISRNLIARLPYKIGSRSVDRENAVWNFKRFTRKFIQSSFESLARSWPVVGRFSLKRKISNFRDYEHLRAFDKDVSLKNSLGDYIITPDIVVAREPITDLSKRSVVAKNEPLFRYANAPTLHASISCKWTIRSDRSQNSRTEGLNLIRNRKGRTPHIAVLTGEPMPTRIASIAVGTGDIDCVYHFALHELAEAIKETKDDAAIDSLAIMIEGRRLRDISDLPFDLAI